MFFLEGWYKEMNRTIGMVSSVINGISIIGFAISMVLGNNYSSYFCSMFIAFSFVPMMCAYAYYSERKYKVAGFTSVGFAAMYATMIQPKPSAPQLSREAQLTQGKLEIEANFNPYTDEIAYDRFGRRWVQCRVCKKIVPSEACPMYGGRGAANLGICYDCSRK